MVIRSPLGWTIDQRKLQELCREFIRVVWESPYDTEARVLNFLKERIFKPNNVQYIDYGDYLKVIDPRYGKIYLFLYTPFMAYNKPASVERVIAYVAQKTVEDFKRSRMYDIDELGRYEIFAINKGGILIMYFDTGIYSWRYFCLLNDRGECDLDESTFERFLMRLADIGIIKRII